MAPHRPASRAARLGLGAWFGLMVCVAAYLLARHLVPLPVPTAEAAEVQTAFGELRAPDERRSWAMFHVLYADCRCSGRIVAHLTSGARPGDVVERVVMVGRHEEDERKLARADIPVVHVTAEELLERYGVEAGPLLVVLDPHDRVMYAGGYTSRKQGLDVKDLAILELLRAGTRAEELPLYGCPISQGLRATSNPLGL